VSFVTGRQTTSVRAVNCATDPPTVPGLRRPTAARRTSTDAPGCRRSRGRTPASHRSSVNRRPQRRRRRTRRGRRTRRRPRTSRRRALMNYGLAAPLCHVSTGAARMSPASVTRRQTASGAECPFVLVQHRSRTGLHRALASLHDSPARRNVAAPEWRHRS